MARGHIVEVKANHVKSLSKTQVLLLQETDRQADRPIQLNTQVRPSLFGVGDGTEIFFGFVHID